MSSNPPKPRARVTYGKSRRALRTGTSTRCIQFSDDDEDEGSNPLAEGTMPIKAPSSRPNRIPPSTSNSSIGSSSSSQSRTKRAPLAEKDTNIPKSTGLDSVVEKDQSCKAIRKHRKKASLAQEEDAVTMMSAKADPPDVVESVRGVPESESDESLSLIVQPARRFGTNARSYGRRAGERSRNPVVLSSDSSESESEEEVTASTSAGIKPRISSPERSRRPSTFLCVEIVPMTHQQRTKARQRTAVKHAAPDQTATVTSSLTEQLQGLNFKSSDLATAYPIPLTTLLKTCKQSAPMTFDAALQTIEPQGQDCVVQKAGEASYSEVFRLEIPDQNAAPAILKVVPLRCGSNSPEGSSPTDVYREVAMTIELADSGHDLQPSMPGFVTLHSATVVKGAYPERFLEAWDEFEPKGDLDPRDHSPQQLFCLLHLSDGGVDLENTSVRNWTESLSIFAQVVNILADAETHCSFEHRDLHWGNVVIKRLQCGSAPASDLLTWDRLASPQASDLHVQLIDFTLSRITKGKDVLSFDLSSEPTLFEADASEDYQFEVYRLMRQHLRKLCSNSRDRSTRTQEQEEEDWTRFAPGTNVIWLHYLLRKLLEEKAPSKKSKSRRKAPGRQISLKRSGRYQSDEQDVDKEAHDVLKQLEPRLAQEVKRLCTQPDASGPEGTLGRRASRVGSHINSAVDLRGWFQRRG